MGLGREYLPSISGPDAVKYPVRYLDIWQHTHTHPHARARIYIMPYRDERRDLIMLMRIKVSVIHFWQMGRCSAKLII